MNVAVLLSTDAFEEHFEGNLGLSRDQYLHEWRNGWVWSYCRMLSSRGIRPSVFIATTEAAGRYETREGYRVRLLPIAALYIPWLRFPSLKRTPPGRYLAQAANAASILAPLRRALAEDEIDVLMVQEYWTARCDVLARALRLPIIAIDQGFSPTREFKGLKRGTFKRVSKVIVQTPEEKALAARLGADAVVVQNAVDSDFFLPPPQPRPQGRLLSIAQLKHSHKRTGDLIRALAHLPSRWTLDLVGTGPDERMLRRLAAALGLEHRVNFVGFVGDRDEIRIRLQRCSVFALPSAREGLPMALLEAMSCQAPVVGSAIPAIANVLTHESDGIVVPVQNPQKLAYGIERAESLGETLGKTARETVVRRFSERRTQEVLGSLCAEVVGVGPSP